MNNFLQHLRDEQEVEHWSVMLQCILTKSWLLGGRRDTSTLEVAGNLASLHGGI